MVTTRLSTKGQIILPKSIRDARGWKPGTEFTIDDTGNGILVKPLMLFPPKPLEEIVGCLGNTGKLKTQADIDAAIRKAILRRRDRGRY